MSKMGCPQSDTDPNTVTVLRKSGPTTKSLKSQSALNAALRSGTAIDTQKKMMSGGNRQHTSNKNTASKTKLYVLTINQSILCEIIFTLAEYENGKAVPNQQILQKMERALGVKLRGKDIGQPLATKAPKK
uniref:HTH cro/C1-type domain-containing protein n=1 Tax=Heterorhabditis bacteriophora TaxID=37862 RepID=A0A1I7WN36_HETBA